MANNINKEHYARVRVKYLDWLLTPPGERTPSTKTEFAEENNVSRPTLWRWEDDEDFQTELRATLARWGVSMHADIMHKLMEIGMSRSDGVAVQALKTLLQHITVDTGEEDPDTLTDAQFDKVKEALRQAGFGVLGDE